MLKNQHFPTAPGSQENQLPAENSERALSRRERQIMDVIHRRGKASAAEVLRDLYVMKSAGNLSFGQLRLFERSRRMVVHELSIALGEKPERIESWIVDRIRVANEIRTPSATCAPSAMPERL